MNKAIFVQRFKFCMFFLIISIIIMDVKNVFSKEYEEIWKSQKFKEEVTAIAIRNLNGNKFEEIFVGSEFEERAQNNKYWDTLIRTYVSIHEWNPIKQTFVRIYKTDDLFLQYDTLEYGIGEFYYLPTYEGFLLYTNVSRGVLLVWDKDSNDYEFNFKKELYKNENKKPIEIEDLDEKAKEDSLFLQKVVSLLEKEIPKHSYAHIKIKRGDTNKDKKEDVWAIVTEDYKHPEGYLYQYEWFSDGKSLIKKFVDKKMIFEVMITDIDNDGMDEIIEGEAILDHSGAEYEGEGPEPILEPTTGKLYILKWDGKIYKEIWQSEEIGGVKTIAVGDVDNDGKKEIVVGDWQGYIHIFHSKP